MRPLATINALKINALKINALKINALKINALKPWHPHRRLERCGS